MMSVTPSGADIIRLPGPASRRRHSITSSARPEGQRNGDAKRLGGFCVDEQFAVADARAVQPIKGTGEAGAATGARFISLSSPNERSFRPEPLDGGRS